MNTLFLFSTLLVGQALALPIELTINTNYKQGDGDNKVERKWQGSVVAELGKTFVVDECKKLNCEGKQCEEEEFRTELTPEDAGNGYIRIRTLFTHTLGKATTKYEGTIHQQLGNSGMLMQDSEDGPEEYYLKISSKLIENKQSKSL